MKLLQTMQLTNTSAAWRHSCAGSLDPLSSQVEIAPKPRVLLMLETAIAAAAKLVLAVTATGVQTEQQFDWLRSLGRSRAHVPLFGSPVAADKIRELLEAGFWRHNLIEKLARLNFKLGKNKIILYI